MKRLFVMLPLILVLCACKEHEADRSQVLDDIVMSYMNKNNIPGAEVLIWINGDFNYHRAFGFADIEKGIKRQINQPFRIASISKTFTALRILQMHDEGLIDINDSLVKYMPEFPNAEAITLSDLLGMTSGITDFADHDFLGIWYEDLDMEFSMEKAVNISAMKSDSFLSPGEKVVYSNVNYTLLGFIIEKVTGNSVGSEFSEHIFLPLGLQNTFYPSSDELPGGLRGYSLEKEGFADVTKLNPAVPHTGGAVISDMNDLWIFVQALYNGSLISEDTLRKQQETRTMDKSPEWVRYGLGILDLGGFWGHNGTIFGFSSEMFYLPRDNAVIIINVNRLDRDDKSWSGDLFLALSKQLFPEGVKWNNFPGI